MTEVSWARGRALTDDVSAGDRIFKTLVQVTNDSVNAEIAHLEKGFNVREGLLNDIIITSRYNSIETFLQQEFARQRVELGAEIFTAVIGETSTSNVYTALSDTRRQLILNESYRKVLKSYETYMRRMRVIRSAFLRTFEFFRATTESTLTKLQEKHAREIMLNRAMNSMTIQNVENDGKNPETETAQHLRASQMRERHGLEISNIREFNERTSAREIALLEFHLNSTESILAADVHLLQRLIEQKLDDEGMLAQMVTNEKVAAADEVRRERHANAERLRATQASMKKETQINMDSDRKADRDERKRDFAQQGISIVDNALYQLTFSTRDVDQPVDSVLDSDDSDDSGEDDDAAEMLMNVPSGVTSLQKKMKKESLARRRERRRKFEMRVHETKKSCKDVMHKLTAELKGGISDLYAVHEQQLKVQTGKWSALREELRANHIAAADDLEVKHTTDRHVLLEADRKQHRSQVQQSDVKAQSAMADHVFAEVRNVLSAMMGIADNLQGSSEEELEHFASRQKTICRYAVDTMTNMLEITQHSDGIHESTTEIVRLNDLVTRVKDIQQDKCSAAVLLCSAVTDVCVMLDRQLVTQLLVDMLSNSLKFTSEGKITVVAKEIDRNQDANTVTIEFGIADSGDGGISLEEAAIDSSRRRDSGHDYLLRNASYGLYLIKLIATTLKAPAQLVTPLPPDHEYRGTQKGGAGSYLFVNMVCKLPASCPPPPEPVDALASPERVWKLSPAGHMRVLIADDQRLVRVSLIQMLCKLIKQFPACSMHIKTVRSAEEASRVMHTETFDLVFLDQNYDATSVGSTSEQCNAGFTVTADCDTNEVVRQFLKRETFGEQEGDGVKAGTDVLNEFSDTPAIMLMATGSILADMHSEVCLLKPFSVNDFIASFEKSIAQKTSSLMKRLHLKNDKMLIKTTNIVLFT
jgi:CheY-like chemotaxis protein